MRKTALLISTLFLNWTVAQQEASNDIDEVKVYGKLMDLSYKNVNENITIVTKAELENIPAKSIDELLQYVAGVDAERRGANGVQTDISIRGGSFEQVLIMINGIRMNDSQTGHNSMNIPVDLSNVERIEIVKGPTAKRFGNNAYSGVINIVTKTSSDEKIKISAEGGDYSTYRLGLGATFGNENFTHLFQANSAASEGYRYNTDYKINNIFYQNQLRWDTGKLQFQSGFSEKKFGANGFYASPKYVDQYEETQASVVSVMLNQQIGKLNLQSSLFWRRAQDMYVFNRKNPSQYRNMHIGNNIGGELSTNYTSSLGTTGLGIDLRKEILVSNNLGKRNRMITQLFFEHQFSFFKQKLKLVPGISWADFSSYGSYFYPGIDAGFNFNEHHKLYGNISKVNRIPSFTDLYYKSKTELGNENLVAEQALSYELGYRYSRAGFEMKTAFFERKTNNGIDWIKDHTDDLWRAENIGKMDTRGAEIELNHRLNRFVKNYSISYTYTDNKVTQKAPFSKYVLNHLKHQFVARAEYRLFGNFSNQLVYRYNERATGYSYHLLDSRLSYHTPKANIYLLVNNLTNTDYREAFGVPMPKRWFHIGITYQIDFSKH